MPFPTAPISLVGYERSLFGFLDSNSNFTGSQTTLSNGSTSGAYVWSEVRTASYQPEPPVNLALQGGDVIYNRVRFGNQLTQPFQIIGSSYDQTLSDLVSASTSNTTNTQATISAVNDINPRPRAMVVMLQGRAEGTDGTHYYVTRIFPQCLVTIANNGPSYQGQIDTILDVTPQATTHFINGMTYDATANTGLSLNLYKNKTDHVYYISTNPVHFMAFRQNAVATTFTTTFLPASSTITLNATPNWFFVASQSTALTSLSTTTGLATLTAAGSAGVADLLIYETNNY